MSFSSTFALRRSERAPSPDEAVSAVVIEAWLYLAGGLLCGSAVLLPHVTSPVGVAAVALDAFFTAGLLLFLVRRGHAGLGLAAFGDVWGIAIIAILCASAGGSSSPFGLIYFFAIGHAGAFQPLRRLIVIFFVGVAAFLAPLVYEAHVSDKFGAVVVVGVALAALTSAVLHSALNRVREQRRRLEILLAATARLDKSLDPAETLRTVASMAVPALAELCVIDLLDASGSIGGAVAAAGDPELARAVEGQRRERLLEAGPGDPVVRVLAGEVPYLLTDSGSHSPARERRGEDAAGSIGDVSIKRAAVFPMVARGHILGAISFLRLESDARFGSGLVAVLEDLAGRAAMAFDNARLYEERAHVARTLRRSLMPAVLPEIPGLGLASYFRPMGAGSEVGGDFYDAFGDRESCWLIVGDVCGKGAEAAALTGFLRNTAAAYAREGGLPADVLTRVNDAMLDTDFDGRFATAILAHMRQREDGIAVTVAVAGHPAALVIRADGSVGELGGGGALLGIFPDPAIEDVSTVLGPGDALALYTDGLSEAHAPAKMISVGEMIGRLESTRPASAKDAIDGLLGLIDVEDGVRDDIAILAARVQASQNGAAPSATPSLL